ncbi:MAG TPA: MFS transporter [Candidatus Limnocylindrales bacterium]
MPGSFLQRRGAALFGYLGFILLGWSGLLLPSLVRSIEHDFGQSDAGIGVLYFLTAASYAAGSFGGGVLVERFGWRRVLAVATLLGACGLALQAVVSSWELLLLATLPRGLGSGAIDGGSNGLFLDLYPTGRGRALNLLHLFFSLGAFASPLAVGQLVDAHVPWQAILALSALAWLPLAALILVADVPAGHHLAADKGARAALRPLLPLVLLGTAIATYVGAEIGVSNWLVRFLESAPLTVATLALALFWGGLTLGRLLSAAVADRFDHASFAIASTLVASIALVAAILVPVLPVAILLFAFVGFAFGPVYPLIMALAGERFPSRAAAVSGFLAGTSVVGSIVYPPVAGFLSVTVGLSIAMLGMAVLGFICAGALLVLATRTAPASSEQVAFGRSVPNAGGSGGGSDR